MEKFLCKSTSPVDEHQQFVDDIYSLYHIKPERPPTGGTKRSRKSEPAKKRDAASEKLARSREAKSRKSLPSRGSRFDFSSSSSEDENDKPTTKKKTTVNVKKKKSISPAGDDSLFEQSPINMEMEDAKNEQTQIEINLCSSDSDDANQINQIVKQTFVLEVRVNFILFRIAARNKKRN
jgi:hypothetical protein